MPERVICQVKTNCLNHLQQRDKCWYCNNYNQYIPKDKKILSPTQEERRLERKLAKKEKKNTDMSKRGKMAKRKGYKAEHELEKILPNAKRVPLSGALDGYELSNDLKMIVNGVDKRIEVKHRKSVPVSCYKWLGIKNNCGVRTLAYDVDNPPNYLIMRKDNMPWLVVMPLDEFLLLIPKEE